MPSEMHDVLEKLAPAPGSTPDIDEIVRGGIRLRRRRRAGTALAATCLAVAGWVAGPWLVSNFDRADGEPPGPSGRGVDVRVTRVVVAADNVDASGAQVWASAPGQLLRIDPANNDVIHTVTDMPVNSNNGIAVGEGVLWTFGWQGDIGNRGPDGPQGKVQRLDTSAFPTEGRSSFADAGSTVFVSEPGDVPYALASGFGAAWVVEIMGDTLVRFSDEGEPTVTIPVGHSPVDVATGEGSVWVIHTRSDPQHYGKGDATLMEIDPTTNAPIGDPTPAGTCPHSVAVGAGAVWVLDYCDEAIRKFDPGTHALLGTIELDHTIEDVAVGGGFVWSLGLEAGVTLLNPESLEVVGGPTDVGRFPQHASFGHGSLWVTGGDGLVRVEPQDQGAAQDS